MSYYIHDNGGRPFRVDIDTKGGVLVYKLDEEKAFLTFSPQEIFIGKSFDDTKYFEGPEFDGNTILLRLKDDIYVYIGPTIYTFKPLADIIEFVSNLRGSDIAYPYAIDSDGNRYLMLYQSIMWDRKTKDPYEHFYDVVFMVGNGKTFRGITNFFINESEFTMSFNLDPWKKWEMLCSTDFEDGHGGKNKLYIEKDDIKVRLTKDEYVSLIEDYGSFIGIEKMDIQQILQERLN